MTNQSQHRAVIMGLGYIGGADQVSGDALGQLVVDLDGTHIDALANHPRVDVVAGSSRDLGRRERFTERTGDRDLRRLAGDAGAGRSPTSWVWRPIPRSTRR